MRVSLPLVLVALFLGAVPARAASDPEAVALAERTLQAMGGAEAWNDARVLAWDFFGRRSLWWDKHTGDVRIEVDSLVTVVNLNSGEGRAWVEGEPLAGEALAEALENARKTWVNDSYWLVMPYKLLDPGVNLVAAGADTLPGARPADVLEVTFDEGVGVTPQNRYRIWIARESGLVEQWAFYTERTDDEPRFTLPWGGWRRFGSILLATEHGQGADWNIRVLETPPEGIFSEPVRGR